jgi:hypothetical protein
VRVDLQLVCICTYRGEVTSSAMLEEQLLSMDAAGAIDVYLHVPNNSSSRWQLSGYCARYLGALIDKTFHCNRNVVIDTVEQLLSVAVSSCHV